MTRTDQHLARQHTPGGAVASAVAAKEEVGHQAVWRAARQLWGEVPDKISRERMEDGDYELLNRIVMTATRKAEEAVEIARDEFIGRMKRPPERSTTKVLIRVKRDSIEIESVFTAMAPHSSPFSE